MKERLKYIPIYRITVIVWMAFRFLMQILWFQKTNRNWTEETERKWNEMLQKQADEYRRKAISLGGLLIKFGQFLSSRGDLLPQSFIKELEGLVDRVKPVPFSKSKAIIEDDWQSDLDEYVEWIEEDAVASASIGEVYQAKLKDGTLAAIKVRRYRVDEIFKMDYKALRIVFWMINRFTRYGRKADLPALYQEVVRVISNELDFTKELKNGNQFKKRFHDFPNVYIPEYNSNLSTKRVLVMEWIEGAKVTDLAFIRKHQLDRERIAKTLFDLCIEQFLYNGMFHSDPHPGNLMLKPDGTLVVIDFGMVGEVRDEDVRSIRKIVQGFILEDYDMVVQALEQMGFLLPNADSDKVKNLLKQSTDLYLDGNFDKLDPNTMNETLEEIEGFIKDQPIQLPADYAFLGRATSIIVGVLSTVHPQIDLIEWGRPVIRDWISGDEKQSTASLYTEVAKETARPLLSLPRALVNYLEDGDKERDWKTQHQQKQMSHQFYLFYALLSFIMMLAGVGLMLVEALTIMWITSVITGIGLIGVVFCLVNHWRMIKDMTKQGRNGQ
ncbi:AarF/ABC1/UbiB kinase family protein [Halobacillus litoralis]|uniref:ABC1 kinase family protein n=1 Tax=Halobacillus litoralis TaxID=45668 RepID=UPI001CD7CB94|nr:AarF/UbiB family protein [Halobacillus litoralis]MCA0971090.1 AarF/ABC1/UbiB kinase family protein [Halobacillus litoralis]